ncbi:uncharacterized protein J8A68_006163 [[Candida] subhashii]|uniref:t-SNARE affecting a late Golgi compartment protein 1 n=1 Tax=[Candida] subhashii TaxID=561895 RepID=A0A8J5QFR4_9ASCO|nr:uncharacterized protein J8A68_006163 [[Candida] subhashii]KAG7660326.1 hypothetical protein J8A68_006163 [[Candida] subhashii]
MDPFNEVNEDAWNTISILENLISQQSQHHQPSPELTQDFNNNYQELQEIYQDLQQAVSISQSHPSQFNLTPQDIKTRQDILQSLSHKITDLKRQWTTTTPRPITTMSNRISQDNDDATLFENPFTEPSSGMTQYQQQELIQQQDVQLDNIHVTMKNLNQQAQLMGNELEDQGYMLEELDYELENVDNKLQRGLKRVNIFLEKNKETASNWCIGILVVVLCVLLVVLIAI